MGSCAGCDGSHLPEGQRPLACALRLAPDRVPVRAMAQHPRTSYLMTEVIGGSCVFMELCLTMHCKATACKRRKTDLRPGSWPALHVGQRGGPSVEVCVATPASETALRPRTCGPAVFSASVPLSAAAEPYLRRGWGGNPVNPRLLGLRQKNNSRRTSAQTSREGRCQGKPRPQTDSPTHRPTPESHFSLGAGPERAHAHL